MTWAPTAPANSEASPLTAWLLAQILPALPPHREQSARPCQWGARVGKRSDPARRLAHALGPRLAALGATLALHYALL
jgi:hypothetical protein